MKKNVFIILISLIIFLTGLYIVTSTEVREDVKEKVCTKIVKNNYNDYLNGLKNRDYVKEVSFSDFSGYYLGTDNVLYAKGNDNCELIPGLDNICGIKTNITNVLDIVIENDKCFILKEDGTLSELINENGTYIEKNTRYNNITNVKTVLSSNGEKKIYFVDINGKSIEYK